MAHPIEKDHRYLQLLELANTFLDLSSSQALLYWDQSVNLPKAAGEDRANQISTLAKLRHELFTSDEMGQLLSGLSESFDLSSMEDAPSLVRVIKREYDRATKLPTDFVRRMSKTASKAQSAWEQAKAQDDFSIFQDDLEQIVELSQEKAELLGYEKERYDALLDVFEPEITTEKVAELFSELRTELKPIIDAIAQAPVVDDAFLHVTYDRDQLRDFGVYMLKAIGFDLDRGRLDYSAHPFSTTLGSNDSRLTTFDAPDIWNTLWATLHEGGHGIHSQGVNRHFPRSFLGGSPSYSLSESQSLLFENVVGRSKVFWSAHFPELKSRFPQQLDGVDLDRFHRAINKVVPSLIRVMADELTYHFHIMLRFELERALIDGRLQVADLPQAWNEKMSSYLGLVPPSDREGVLQDIHWSDGSFGYFPSYSLGALLAVQFYAKAKEERPQIEEELAEGRCNTVRAWMDEKIYQRGEKLSTPQLVEEATGEPLTVKPFLAYVKEKYGELYSL